MTDLSPDERVLCDKLVRRLRTIPEGFGEVTFTVVMKNHKSVILKQRTIEDGFTVEEVDKL